MTNLPLENLYYHKDYDGVVAAAMVQANCKVKLKLYPVQYSHSLNWNSKHLAPRTGIVDFLYHPSASLWIDHHATTFGNSNCEELFKPDSFHVFVPNAMSCPDIIVNLPWFERDEHWDEYIYWANIIDGAAYTSPVQANDISNGHLLLSHVIGRIDNSPLLAKIVQAIPFMPVNQVLDLAPLKEVRNQIIGEDLRIREELKGRVRLQNAVALLDQSNLTIPYHRYLVYELYPNIRYGIGVYRNGNEMIVSVGENPWNKTGSINLGALCKEFGGGGRQSTAGVPMTSTESALSLAGYIAYRLNVAMESEERTSHT